MGFYEENWLHSRQAQYYIPLQKEDSKHSSANE